MSLRLGQRCGSRQPWHHLHMAPLEQMGDPQSLLSQWAPYPHAHTYQHMDTCVGVSLPIPPALG